MVDEWEAGTRTPTAHQLQLLADLTGFTVEFFYLPDPPPLTGFICQRTGPGRGCSRIDTRPVAPVVSFTGPMFHVKHRRPSPHPTPCSNPPEEPAHMAVQSTIEWTEATWNPLIGCTSVSPGCDNCYARTQVNTRFHPAALANGGKHLEAFPTPFDTVSIRPDRFLTQPLHWATPKRIFVNSLSDLFHQDVPDEFIAKVFAVMALAQRHTFQLLTKRHGRMHSLLSSVAFTDLMLDAAGDLAGQQPVVAWPLPNVWLGVSVENQQWADIRIPMLLNTPAAIRWLSCEPLLGPLTLSTATRAQIDWVVAGGESGPGARPMHPDWARSLRDECTAADVAFFFKQWGNWAPFPVYQGAEKNTFVMNATTGEGTYYSQRNQPGNAEMWNVGKKAAGRELDGRTWSEMPAAVPV